MLSTAVPSSESVGVISDLVVTFDPRIVTRPTTIKVSLVLNADLGPGSTVAVVLPDFRGTSADNLNFSASTTDGNFLAMTGRWDLATTTLTVQVHDMAIRNKPVAFAVDASSNLRLPIDGIRVNHTGFSIGTNASDGHVTAMPFAAQLVSIFTAQQIELSSAAALMACGINLSFSLACAMGIGDEVILRLPNFAGDPVSVLNLTGAGGNWTGSWSSPDLVLRARLSVPENQVQRITVAAAEGITIPEYGVSTNQNTITLSARASLGAVDNSTFEIINPVGAFRMTRLEFLPHMATIVGNAVGIKIRFAPVYSIASGEVVFLTLPGFRRLNVASLNVSTESGPEWHFTGSFSQNGSSPRLYLTTGGTLVAHQQAVVDVRIDNGIVLPIDGLVHNQSSLRIGSLAALGSSVGQPILLTPAVGVFTASSVHFGSALAADSRANTSSSILVKFTYSKEIRTTETVTLQLPMFTGEANPLLAVSSSVSLTASWDPLTSALQLTLNDTVGAGIQVEAAISESNGITLPVQGVEMNQSRITLATNAAEGNSSPVPVLLTEPVGAFLVSSLAFVNAAATMPARIVLTFVLNCALEAGDGITLSMPNFYGTDNGIINVSSLNFNGSWSASSATISLTATREATAGTAKVVTMEASEDIRMPVRGIGANDSAYLVGADARLGPTLGVSFQQVMPIGSFLQTKLDFMPKAVTRLGTAVALTISFVVAFPVDVGERIFLFLPGFRGAERSSLAMSPLSSTSFNASYSLAGSQPEIVLTAFYPVSSMQSYEVRLSSSNGIVLPIDGLVHNQSSLRIGSLAALGSSVGQPILLTPAVGVFTASSVHFGSALAADSRANTSSSILVKFTYSKEIRTTETVTLQLPMFTGEANPLLAVSSSVSLTASWDPLTSALQLTLNDTVGAGIQVEAAISESNGITLPVQGVEMNQSRITLATNAAEGNSSPVPVLLTEPVGAFLVSSLAFVNAAATMPARIVLTFVLNCALEAGDGITLSMPNFYGTDNGIINVSSLNFNGSWSASSATISLTATREATAGTAKVVTMEASEDIRMPVRGIGANDSAYLVGADARLGPTLGVSFQQVMPIGSFLFTSLHISPRVATVAGISVGLNIRFTLNAELIVAAGEIVFLVLPGFRGHSNGSYSVLAETVGDYIIRVGPLSGEVFRTFSCSWSNITERLSFTANTQVTGDVDITIPKESFLALPASGIVANSSSFLLGTNAALGPSVGQSVLLSPSVGSFVSSSIAFTNARAGGVADVQLNFSLVNEIQTGETVTFTLPEFSGPNISSQASSQTQSAFNFTLDWKNETKKLILRFLDPIAGNTLVYLTIPASNNLALPPGGLGTSHPITIETDAGSGPVDGIPVLSIPPVGKIEDSSFRWCNHDLDCDSTHGLMYA